MGNSVLSVGIHKNLRSGEFCNGDLFISKIVLEDHGRLKEECIFVFTPGTSVVLHINVSKQQHNFISVGDLGPFNFKAYFLSPHFLNIT